MTAALVGVQEPRVRITPSPISGRSRDDTDELTLREQRQAKRAVRLARAAGLDLLPWQEADLRDICWQRITENGPKWQAQDAADIVSRQNGKGGVLEARALAGLFIFGERRILWTAQLQRTSTDAHRRMVALIRNTPKLDEQVAQYRFGKGDEAIILKDGRMVMFFTRSDAAGRGLFADCLILDEAYDISDEELASLRPTTRTARNLQIIYTSTPVDELKHVHGIVLARVRKRALAGKTAKTLWIEHSVPEWNDEDGPDQRPWDREMWALANPSLGYLFEVDTIEGDLEGMGQREFLVEDLCAPDFWPDPDLLEAEDVPLDPKRFALLADPESFCLDPVVLGLDVSPGSRRASLVVAGWRPDGRKHAETIARRDGTDWVLPAVLQLIERWDIAVLILDAAGPAGSLIPNFRAEGLEPMVTGSTEMGRACEAYVDDADADRIRHRGNDAPLNGAVEVVKWRPLGDGGRAFGRKLSGGDIAPVVGHALACWALDEVVASGIRTTPASPRVVEPVTGGESLGGGTDDLVTLDW